MKDGGHRLWAIAAKTRNTTKSGTAILARATIAPRPGDGQVWAKPDGKAMAVALTIGERPVYLLAAHLPHTDAERVAFLTEVADGVAVAAAAHAQTPEGRPWAQAAYLWAADLNLTCNPALDNESPSPRPRPRGRTSPRPPTPSHRRHHRCIPTHKPHRHGLHLRQSREAREQEEARRLVRHAEPPRRRHRRSLHSPRRPRSRRFLLRGHAHAKGNAQAIRP